MNERTLKVAEHFFSIQGEGKTVGKASVFLRMSGCRLNCVWCDTAEVWKKGTTMTHAELQDLFDANKYTGRNAFGAHLIVTGGDPLIQQVELAVFLKQYRARTQNCYTEVETEGVIKPLDAFNFEVMHYNVSPKLANSRMAKIHRFKPDVLAFHAQRPQDIFKFPVADHSDALEALDICNEVNIPRDRVYFMPICVNRKEHEARGPGIAQLAMLFGVNYSPRLHLLLWDKATGV